MSRVEGSPPLVEMRGISKFFGGVAALRAVDFAVRRNEVVALLGDNGAGKSTLIKALSGVQPPDEGAVLIDGMPVHLDTPKTSKAAGIETVYQDLALCDNLDVTANLFLGREVKRGLLGPLFSFFDGPRMTRDARTLLDRLNIEIPSLKTAVRHLSGGQRQSIAIAKAVYGRARVLIMDEPTAALGVVQTEKVLRLVRDLCAAGIAVVYISHIMEDVFKVADRMVVLKNGRRVGERATADTDRDEIVRMMITGRDERAALAPAQ
jgi:D-xylose transport system ATP-binding protein